MNPRLTRSALLAAFALVVGAALFAVRGNEHILDRGRIVLVRLAPVDPRSLMQGDYMALAYAIDAGIPRGKNHDAYAHLALDAAGRATLVTTSERLPDDPALVAMKLRARHGGASIGPNGFFFQEGRGPDFARAQWGEFRVDAQGKALLTHLRGEDLQRLGENRR